jgi:uncharacterized protein (TIGR03437 family)
VAGIALRAQTLTTLATFGVATGDSPLAGLVQGTDGNFYGTTCCGGPNAGGTVFKITPGGTITLLYSFCTQLGCADGATPRAGLVQASDGNFYGTTGGGGVNNAGTVFRIRPGGVLTTLYSFCPQGGCIPGYGPYGGLIQASDGNLYGTTWHDGVNDYGTVFKITLGGTLTTLHTFCSEAGCTDGDSPRAGLIQGSDGNLYGTTAGCCYGGDVNDFGTIFKITLAGTLTTLYRFTSNPGNPLAGLIQGSDGNFYGTTSGIIADYGTVFKVTPAGILTTLHTFCSEPGCADGLVPSAPLVQASDGSFYGTTARCCGYDDHVSNGTVFKITSDGTLTTIHTFCLEPGCADGEDPEAGLVQGADGNLYGTTSGGTDCSCGGTVYRVALAPLKPVINQSGVVSASAFGEFTSVSPGSWIEIYGSNLAVDSRSWLAADFSGINAPTSLDGTSVTIGGQAAFIDFISPGQVNALVPSNIPTGTQSMTVTVGSLTSPAYNITVNAVQPGFDAPPSFNIGGTQYVVALFADGTYVLPEGAIAGLSSRPAQPGDEIVLYGIGFGPVTPSIPAGQLVQQTNTLASSFGMSIGGVPVTNVPYSGLAPSYTGLYQFNIVLPANPGSGAVPLTFTVDGVAGTQPLYLAVSN